MSRISRPLRSELIYAAAAANAWLRGLSIPCVALRYRYEPLTALHLIRRCCEQYGAVNVEPWVPANVLACAMINGRRMIEDMAQLHITEAELARDTAAVLDRVQAGAEIVIERDAKPVAVLRAAEPKRRKLSEIIAALPQDSTATLDADFAADVQAFIDSHREPLSPPEWD